VVELALTPDSRWDLDPADIADAARADAARAAGFSAVGILGERADDRVAAAYRQAGVRCHEVLALVVTADAGATVGSAERLAAAASAMDAPWVTTVFTRAMSPDVVAALRRCADVLAEAGAGLAVEFSPLGPVPTIRAGLEVVAAVGAERAGLLIDTWHFCLGDSTWDDLARMRPDEIAFVQFTDAPAVASDDLMRETMHRRALPGEGTLELERFASTLIDRGWQGLVSVEVLNRELRTLPIAEFARRAHESTARYWR
jgi:sugar phosphate isomerase/epimerase